MSDKFNTIPFKDVPVPDYGMSLAGAEAALQDLREALPNGDRLRTQRAVLELTLHTDALRLWTTMKVVA